MRTTLRTVINRVVNVSWWRDDLLQDDVFHFDSAEFPSCSPTIYTPKYLDDYLEPCTRQETFDYFSGSAGPYIGTFVAMGCWLVICVVALYAMVQYQKRQRLVQLQNFRMSNRGGKAGRSEWDRLGIITYGNGDKQPVTAYELKVSCSRGAELHLNLSFQLTLKLPFKSPLFCRSPSMGSCIWR